MPKCGWMLVKLESKHAGMAVQVAKTIMDAHKEMDKEDRWCVIRADEVSGDLGFHIVIPAVWRGSGKTHQQLKKDITDIAFEVNGETVEPVDSVEILQVKTHHPPRGPNYQCPDKTDDVDITRGGDGRPDNPWG